jgi:hypothetical protein
VALGGKNPQPLLPQQPLNLAGLEADTHHVAVTEKEGTLDLSIQVDSDGTVQGIGASGLDQYSVVALVQKAERQEIFCRCDGAEIRIDGKTVKHAAGNVYPVGGKGALAHQVMLLRNGHSEQIQLVGTGPKFGMVFIASGEQINQPPPVPPCEVAWQVIKDSNDLDAFKKFMADFPQCPHKAEAYKRSADLAWQHTSASKNSKEVEDYLQEYAGGPHDGEAKAKIAELKEIEAEKAEWEKINKEDLAALAGFIGRHVNGQHHAEAQHLLSAGQEWKNLQQSSDRDVIQSFLQKYGDTPYASKASALLNKPKSPPTAQDEAAWNNINKQDPGAVKGFIDQWQSGKVVQQAREQFANLAQTQWDKISGSSQLADFESFVRTYPGTPRIPEALDRIKQINVKLILDTLENYHSAYEKKDVDRLLQIWPSVPPNLLKTIKDARRISLRLDKGEPAINGDTATVACKQKLQITSREGAETDLPSLSREFRLRKTQGVWIIERIN